jgi:Flp pilus assembly protein TadB
MRVWAPWLLAAACFIVTLTFSGTRAQEIARSVAQADSEADNQSVQATQYERAKSALEKVADQAQKIVDTELLIFGGSIAILLGTGYHRPAARTMRFSYFSFLLAWAALAESMYFGYDIRSVYLAFLLAPPVTVGDFGDRIEAINASSVAQSRWFYGGLAIFGFWLVLYLGWWVLTESIKKEEKE